MNLKKRKLLSCSEIIFLIGLLLIFLIDIITTYNVTATFFDGDASSEMVLAKHIFDNKQLFSSDWYYSTEIRAVCMQLVFSPLFLLFSDWHLVRFVGTIILHIIYISCFGLICHETKTSFKAFCVGASLLLLPVSVSYGRVVLYHCFYLSYIILGFLLFGLIIRFANKYNNKLQLIICTMLIVIISFAGGLNGTRQLLIFNVPLIFGIVCLAFIRDYKTDKASIFSKEILLLFIPSVISIVATFAGYLVNTVILSKSYTFASYAEYKLSILPSSSLSDMLYGFLHLFGFRNNVQLLSILGLVSVMGVFAGVYCVVYSIKLLINVCNSEIPLSKQLFSLFFAFSFIVTVTVFILTGGSHIYFFYLYFVPVTVWSIPTFIHFIDNSFDKISFFNSKILIPVAMTIILFVNGFCNILFFNGIYFKGQLYEGLDYKNKNLKVHLAPVIELIEENDYTLGYSTFWHSNVITELTDGQTEMVHIAYENIDDTNTYLYYFNWLTAKSTRLNDADKAFILVGDLERSSFDKLACNDICTLIFEDNKFSLYEINNLDEFKSTIQ